MDTFCDHMVMSCFLVCLSFSMFLEVSHYRLCIGSSGHLHQSLLTAVRRESTSLVGPSRCSAGQSDLFDNAIAPLLLFLLEGQC